MKKSGYKVQGVNARSMGSNMEKELNIAQRIEDERLNIFDTNKITTEYILQGLNAIAQNGKQEANRVRCWELLGKVKSMFTDKVEHSGKIDYTQAEKDEVQAKRDSVFSSSN